MGTHATVRIDASMKKYALFELLLQKAFCINVRPIPTQDML
jgi:hypothetical protein